VCQVNDVSLICVEVEDYQDRRDSGIRTYPTRLLKPFQNESAPGKHWHENRYQNLTNWLTYAV
jgi:hypothetical protein